MITSCRTSKDVGYCKKIKTASQPTKQTNKNKGTLTKYISRECWLNNNNAFCWLYTTKFNPLNKIVFASGNIICHWFPLSLSNSPHFPKLQIHVCLLDISIWIFYRELNLHVSKCSCYLVLPFPHHLHLGSYFIQRHRNFLTYPW